VPSFERAGVKGHEVVGWFDGWVVAFFFQKDGVGEQTTSQPNHLTTQFPPHPNPLLPLLCHFVTSPPTRGGEIREGFDGGRGN